MADQEAEPEGSIVGQLPTGMPRQPRQFTVISEGSLKDEFRHREMIIVGPEGLAIDRREYQDRWRARIVELRESEPTVGKILAGEQLTEAEWERLAGKLNAPELWFNEASLRKAFEQPTGSLSDFIRAALGLHQFPSREQRIERAFNAWVAEHSDSINPDQARMLHLLRNVVLASVRETAYRRLDPSIFSQAPFTFLGGRTKMESLFGRERLTSIMEELNNIIDAA